MSGELWEDITLALHALGLTHDEVPDAKDVLRAVAALYVRDCPGQWWARLRHVKESIAFDGSAGLSRLATLFQEKTGCGDMRETVYVLADDGRRFFVYSLPFEAVPKLLGECPFFEYYIVPRDYAWLLCETDHNEVIVCARP